MRPAIDLSHERHGQVIDYSDDNDISITQAYDELIEAGLEVKRDEN